MEKGQLLKEPCLLQVNSTYPYTGQIEEQEQSVSNSLRLWTCRYEIKIKLHPSFVRPVYKAEFEPCLTKLRSPFDVRLEEILSVQR